MLHRIAPVFDKARLEQEVFLRRNAVSQIPRVRERYLFVPSLITDCLLAFKGIDAAQGKREVGQSNRNRRVLRSLANRSRSRDIQREVGETLRETDTRALHVVGSPRTQGRAVILVAGITTRGEVHARREGAVGIRLGVLCMCPLNLEVFRERIVGQTLVAIFRYQIRGIEVSRILISLPIARASRQAPRAFRIDFPRQCQVYIITQCKIIPPITKKEASGGFISERRHDDTRRIGLREREEAEWQAQRQGHIFEHQINRPGYDVLLRADFRLRHLDVKVGMFVVITGRIAAADHVQGVVFALLRAPGGNVAFALLGDYVGDVSFLCLEVIAHGFGFVFLPAVFEERIAKLLSDRV